MNWLHGMREVLDASKALDLLAYSYEGVICWDVNFK